MPEVTVRFAATLQTRARTDALRLSVPAKQHEAVQAVKAAVEARIGNDVLYTMVYNEKSIWLADRDGVIMDGDVYTIVPVVLGG